MLTILGMMYLLTGKHMYCQYESTSVFGTLKLVESLGKKIDRNMVTDFAIGTSEGGKSWWSSLL